MARHFESLTTAVKPEKFVHTFKPIKIMDEASNVDNVIDVEKKRLGKILMQTSFNCTSNGEDLRKKTTDHLKDKSCDTKDRM